jgi:hypothetical protein
MVYFPDGNFEIFVFDPVIDGEEIWEIALKDKVFMEIFNDQVNGLTESYRNKHPYEDYKKVYNQKYRNSKQGGILEEYVHLITGWDWAKQKDPSKKFDDLIDKYGRIWETKSFSKDNPKKLHERYKNILNNNHNYIHGWVLGEFQMNYIIPRIIKGNKNGVLNFIYDELNRLEGDIPF